MHSNMHKLWTFHARIEGVKYQEDNMRETYIMFTNSFYGMMIEHLVRYKIAVHQSTKLRMFKFFYHFFW